MLQMYNSRWLNRISEPEMGSSIVSQTVTVESRIIEKMGLLSEVKTFSDGSTLSAKNKLSKLICKASFL